MKSDKHIDTNDKHNPLSSKYRLIFNIILLV